MKTTIPAPDTLAAYERAAEEIGKLRRRGVHCHLEEHGDPAGHHIEVVREEDWGQEVGDLALPAKADGFPDSTR